MKVVDLHPEELLDKEARGVLGDDERVRLDAHLARCATCRFEREVRADFAEELGNDDLGARSPPTHDSSQRIAVLVEGAVKEDVPAKKDPGIEEELPIPGLRPRRRIPRRTLHLALIAAASLLAVGIAAANEDGPRTWLQRFVGSEATVTERAPTPPPLARAPSSVESAIPPPEPVEIATSVTTAQRPEPPLAAATVAPSAATLFEEASAARRRGDYGRAVELHRELVLRHPRSREAQVSCATTGRLLLDRGEPGAALEAFDGYQARGHGDLDESVMVGRATALERVGRSDEARKAWEALLASFPGTPFADHARQRLAASR